MKISKGLLLVGAAVLMAASAMAIPVTCGTGSAANGVDVNPGVGGSQATSTVNNLSIDCTFGGLEFNNFQYSIAGSQGTPSGWNISLAGEGIVNGYVALTFNPSLNGSGNAVSDAHLSFAINGTTYGAYLFDGGPGPSVVAEKVCSASVDVTTGACSGVLLVTSLNASDNQTATASYAASPVVYVWKDIQITNVSGHNSAITEGFAVPEPMTFSLMGAGLLGLGLVRRKLKK